MSITQDIQTLQPGHIVELFELDCTPVGGGVLRFHNGANELGANVVWQGNEYTKYPIEATGFQFSGKGTLPRPVLRVANITGVLGALVSTYQDLVGCKLTRRRTLLKYLDSVNFASIVPPITLSLDFTVQSYQVFFDGNPTADPTAALPDDVYFIDRKASENKVQIEFELAAAFDVTGVQLPRRFIVQNVCSWAYRGGECGYAGTNYFDASDSPVPSSAQDVCGKRLGSCKARFGQYAELPFGAMPAAGLTR